MKRPKKSEKTDWAVLAIFIAMMMVLGACTSDADRASQNLSKAAEQFEIQRHIVGINGITDEILFEVEGRCSIEAGNTGVAGSLEVTCKHGEGDIRKHYVGLSDNVTYITTQVDGFDADEFRTRVIIKPENIVPNFDMVTS